MDSTQLTYIVFAVLAIFFIAILVQLVRLRKERTEDKSFLLMKQDIESLRETVRKSLEGMTNQMGQRLDSAGQAINRVHKGLGELSEATKRVLEVGKDIATLQDILRAPKLRGSLGELFLGELLEQILPAKYFNLQHRFKSGEMVDAVILLGDKLVPIDAKFPLENFRRVVESQSDEELRINHRTFIKDVKKHIDDIAIKYILPDEKTFDFALMYIPAENVYYETIIKDERFGDEQGIFVYSLSKRVIPVSPNSFYAYLQTILLGLKGMQIEKSTQLIINSLARLQGDLDRFVKEFEVLGTHISHSKSKYDEAEKRLDRLGDRFLQITETHQIGDEEDKALPPEE
jgi:DNA recombination protein RmuC